MNARREKLSKNSSYVKWKIFSDFKCRGVVGAHKVCIGKLYDMRFFFVHSDECMLFKRQ